MNKRKIVEPVLLESLILNSDVKTKQAFDRALFPELDKRYRVRLTKKDFPCIDNSCPLPCVGNGFNQGGRKPTIVVAPFFSTAEKDAGKILKDFLNGLNDENLLWENVCFHYFFPHSIRMTYREFLDTEEILIRPKGITYEKFLNDLFRQNICNKLSFEGREFLKKISKVDYLPENIDYEFIRNAAGYLVETYKAFNGRGLDENFMLNNYIEEQLLGVEYLKKVIDIVQPYRIVFTDRKTRSLVDIAFWNKKRIEKRFGLKGTKKGIDSKKVEKIEKILKESSQKNIERYRQYIKDWYEQAWDWDLTVYIEKRVAEAKKENLDLYVTFESYLSDNDCEAGELEGFKSFLEKDVPARRVSQHSINKPKDNSDVAFLVKLERNMQTVIGRIEPYRAYVSIKRDKAYKLVSKLRERKNADEDISDADVETIMLGLYFDKFSELNFELWKDFIVFLDFVCGVAQRTRTDEDVKKIKDILSLWYDIDQKNDEDIDKLWKKFIDGLKINESTRNAILAEFQNVVRLNKELASNIKLLSFPQKEDEDKNATLKKWLKSENRIHRLPDLDGWVVCLNSRIDDLRNYVKGDGEEGAYLELIENIQDAQNKIAEIVGKMEDLGDAREIVEEPEKEKPGARESQTRKEEKCSILEEKIKKK